MKAMRLPTAFVGALVLAGCSSPDFSNPGEKFAKFGIKSLLEGLDWEFERAHSRNSFRTEGRLDEGWVTRIQNWEAAKRELVRRANIASYGNLSRAVSDILIRPMLSSRGGQRLRDLRAAQRRLEMAQRIFDTRAD